MSNEREDMKKHKPLSFNKIENLAYRTYDSLVEDTIIDMLLDATTYHAAFMRLKHFLSGQWYGI